MKLPALHLSPRDRRAVAAGLGLVVLTAAARSLPAAYGAARTVRQRSDAAALELARGRELLLAQGLLRDSLGARASRLIGYAPRFLAGRTSAEAGAELAGLLSAGAARHQVRLVRQDARPDSALGPFVVVTLRVEAEGDITGLAGLLAELEEGVPLLNIPELILSAPEPAAPATQAERLRAELTVTGLRLPRGRN